MNESLRGRAGITLVESLVVIAIVGLLLALFLPALQKVREAANRLVCAAKLSQLGKAVHLYHQDYGAFPPGQVSFLNPANAPAATAFANPQTRGPHVGCLALLLPYLEGQQVAVRIKATRQTNPPLATFGPENVLSVNLAYEYEAWWRNPANVEIAKTRLRLFECPSDDVYEDVDNVSIGQYEPLAAVNTGGPFPVGLMGSASDTASLGRTNYTGVSGHSANFNPRFVGILTNRSRVTMGQVTVNDGMSNTLLFGEIYGGCVPGQKLFADQATSRGIAYSWIASGSAPAQWGINRAAPGFGTISVAYPFAYGFGSKHPAGANFCRADGSVVLLRHISDLWYFQRTPQPALPHASPWGVFQELAGYRDGYRQDTALLE